LQFWTKQMRKVSTEHMRRTESPNYGCRVILALQQQQESLGLLTSALGRLQERSIHVVQWDMSYGLEMCSSFRSEVMRWWQVFTVLKINLVTAAK
jgi:hypothetical protein